MWHYPFPFVSDGIDQPEEPLAPLPAYDRRWRHPSEAADEQRQQHLNNTPPPLSRRLGMAVAIVSTAASVLVLVTVVPHGMNRYSEPADSPTSTSVSMANLAKSRIKGAFGKVNSGESTVSALAITAEDLIAPIDQVGTSDSLTVTLPNGNTVDASVIARDQKTGLAVVKVNSSSTGIKAITEANDASLSILSDDDLDVVDATADTVVPAKVGLSTHSDGVNLPLDIRKSIHNIAAVVNSYGQVLGIAVRRNHSTYLLTMEKLTHLVNAARGATSPSSSTTP